MKTFMWTVVSVMSIGILWPCPPSQENMSGTMSYFCEIGIVLKDGISFWTRWHITEHNGQRFDYLDGFHPLWTKVIKAVSTYCLILVEFLIVNVFPHLEHLTYWILYIAFAHKVSLKRMVLVCNNLICEIKLTFLNFRIYFIDSPNVTEDTGLNLHILTYLS